MTKTLIALTVLANLAAPTVASATTPTETAWSPRGLYGETQNPAGKPVGTVIVIHGGGWLNHYKADVIGMHPEADRFNRYGWRTVNINYRPGWKSVPDMASWYDRVHDRYPGPVCAYGQSAGAHLALMMAAQRPVDCVIGHGAITDLTKVGGTANASRLRKEYVKPSFGYRARRFSPVNREIDAPVLLAASAGDTWSGCKQMRYLQRVRPETRAYCLPVGKANFIHAYVAGWALAREHQRERALLARAARG